MKNTTIETGIRWKVILIGIAMAIICTFMVVYIYNRIENIDRQRDRIENNHRLLLLAGELGQAVNEAQSGANLYVTSRQLSHQRLFREKAADVERLIDSLEIIAGEDFGKGILREMDSLLKEKGRIVTGLNRQFANQSLADTLTLVIDRFNPALLSDSLLVTNTVQDTVVNTTGRRTFFQRLGSVFSPDKSVDTLITVTTQVTDTIRFIPSDRVDALLQAEDIIGQMSTEYNTRITEIQRQVSDLIVTDQNISARISELTNLFSRHIADVSLGSIRDSERSMKRNAVYSVAGGMFLLLFLLLFVIVVILMIIGDVNKGYKAHKALAEANRRITEIMETRHRLLLSVSHDIKSPLGLILSRMALWQDDRSVPEEQVVPALRAGEYIVSMLENLLDFSALEQGKLALSNQPFHLSELLEDTTALFAGAIRAKGLGLVCNFDVGECTEAVGDPVKIKQVIANLLSNALKYTVEGEVGFTTRYMNGRLYFTVCDTGTGIPEDQMELLFVPFARLDRQKDMAHGSGFGMFVVKGLVDLMGGELKVSSIVDEGTCIEVSIPLAAVETATDRESMHILVIDDDPALLSVVKDLLSRLGHQVDVCAVPERLDGSFEQYNLVITDMEMGNTSGKDILLAVRAEGSNTTVVAMTGRGDYGSEDACQDGFDGFLLKPVTKASLLRLTGSFDGPPEAEKKTTTLSEMFNGDRQAIAEIVGIFVVSTRENLVSLRQCIDANDFASARALCHKMGPMFRQMGAGDWADILERMDMHTGGQIPKFWRGHLSDFIREAQKFIEAVGKEYTAD